MYEKKEKLNIHIHGLKTREYVKPYCKLGFIIYIILYIYIYIHFSN